MIMLQNECHGRGEARSPSRPAARIEFSGVIVTSTGQPCIELTGGYARSSRYCVAPWSEAASKTKYRRLD
jgi:hypothetical protein